MSNSEFKSTLKSSDTEEHIDIYFYRPIGYQCHASSACCTSPPT